LVRGTPTAQAEFYGDLVKRFKITSDLPHRESGAHIRGVHHSGIQKLRRLYCLYCWLLRELLAASLILANKRFIPPETPKASTCARSTANKIYSEIGGAGGDRMRQVKCPMPDGSEIASDDTVLGTLEATFYDRRSDRSSF
jgi:hypothetical protein